jgi:hypothetical protein
LTKSLWFAFYEGRKEGRKEGGREGSMRERGWGREEWYSS